MTGDKNSNYLFKVIYYVVVFSIVLYSESLTQIKRELPMEQYRPQFHFTPETNWMNDPNGLVYFMGEYHLFYQHNPFGNKWGHMSWGHAVSEDLVHWQHLPVALSEENDEMIFSGCAVVDWKNTSGFGRQQQPPIVAIYTGRRNNDDRQYQCIAYSNDRGRTFTKYEHNPVIDIESDNFRDPKVFWYEPGKNWIMMVALAVENKICFYKSENLKEWSKSGEFNIDEIEIKSKIKWECPDLFPLAIDENPKNTKWVMIISTIPEPDVINSGTKYLLGEFNGSEFIIDNDTSAGLNKTNLNNIDYGRDFYAASSWSDIPESDGRRIWIGWMNNWEYADKLPTNTWKGSQTIPREVKLKIIDKSIKLIQKPVDELKKLRGERLEFTSITIDELNESIKRADIDCSSLEIIAEFDFKAHSVFGLKIRKSEKEETTINFNSIDKTITLDRSKSGVVNFNKNFAESHKTILEKSDKLKLHLFIDSSSIELFVNEGDVVFTDLIFPSHNSTGIEFFVSSGEVIIRNLKIWEI